MQSNDWVTAAQFVSGQCPVRMLSGLKGSFT